MRSVENRGSFYAILSGFLYGFIGYFGLSAIHGHLSISTMLFWRFLIASVFVLLFIIPQIKRLRFTFKQMKMAFFAGIFYYGISTWLYFLSCNFISSGLAMVLFFTYPVMIMFINYYFYDHLIPKIYYLAIAIILLGMLFLVDIHGLGFNLKGIFFALASGFFYACYVMMSKKTTSSPQLSTLMVCLGCMTTALIISLATHTLALPSSALVWLDLGGIGILATAIPVLLMFASLKYISSEKAAILSVLEPVFVVVFGVLLLGETIYPAHCIGILLILSGAVLTLFSHRIPLENANLLEM